MESNVNVINFRQLFGYVGQGVRPYVEGEYVLNAKHLVLCGSMMKTDSKLDVFALCLKTSDLKGQPHELTFVIHKNSKIIKGHCSCPAGVDGKCKHGTALLLFLNRIKEEELEDLSCTDLKQQWGKLKGSVVDMYKPIPLKEFCHVKKVHSSSIALRKMNFLDLLLDGNNDCTIALAKSRVLSLSKRSDDGSQVKAVHNKTNNLKRLITRILELKIAENLQEDPVLFEVEVDDDQTLEVVLELLPDSDQLFYKKNIAIDLEESIYLCLHTISQASNLYKIETSRRISGNSAYTFIKAASYTTKFDWKAKVNEYVYGQNKEENITLFELKCKNYVIEQYEKANNIKTVKVALIVNSCTPWIADNPDAIVVDTKVIIIESPPAGKKSCGIDLLNKLKFMSKMGENFVLSKDNKFYCKCQLSMLLTGLRICDFIIYSDFDKSFQIFNIKYDYESLDNYLMTLKFVYFFYFLPALVAKESNSTENKTDIDNNNIVKNKAV